MTEHSLPDSLGSGVNPDGTCPEKVELIEGVFEDVTMEWEEIQTHEYKDTFSCRADVDSMRGYSKSGFGMNYCAENHAQFEDAVEGACFWGSGRSCCVCVVKQRYRDCDCAGGYRVSGHRMRENSRYGRQMAS